MSTFTARGLVEGFAVDDADRVVFAWCDPGHVDGAFAQGVALLYAQRKDRIAQLTRVEGGEISRQRNDVVRIFLQGSAQWLMSCDSDQRITVDAFDKLIAIADAKDRPAVAGLVFAGFRDADENLIPTPTIYVQDDDGVYVSLGEYPDDSLLTVDSAGGGFWMVHRRVLEAIYRAAPDDQKAWCWFRGGAIGNAWLSEDHYFWGQVRASGFPIIAHTGAILQHRKRIWLDDRQHKEARNG